MIQIKPGRKITLLSCLTGILMMFSSFIVPSSLRFFPMLMAKADVATLMANSKFSHIILVNTNIGADDYSRLSYQLSCYAYNTSSILISPYNPLNLTKSIADSSYSKDAYFSTYKVLKATLSTIIPTEAYSYLRFTPYTDKADAYLANYICYSVYPVGADGVTKVGTAIIKLNPSPPR